MYTPDFTKLVNMWQETMNREDANKFLDKDDFVFYFTKDDIVFVGTEDARMVFARIKSPDDETPKNWGKEASFMAVNAKQAIKSGSDNAQQIFNHNDMKNIKIIDKETAIDLLEKD